MDTACAGVSSMATGACQSKELWNRDRLACSRVLAASVVCRCRVVQLPVLLMGWGLGC